MRRFGFLHEYVVTSYAVLLDIALRLDQNAGAGLSVG
jgi:hypothetical protein